MILKTSLLFFSISILSACQSNWHPSSDFGSSVNNAVNLQVVNPSAPESNKKPTKGLDGAAAKAGVDGYQRSFERKVNTGAYAGGGVLTPPSSGNSKMYSMGTSTK